MSWASLANNEAVSRNNLQNAVSTGVFTLKNTIPATNECVTKDEADFYVFLNTSNPGYAAKASNQLVVKNDLSTGAPSIYMTVTTGLYPVTGPSNTATGNIYNNTGGSVYFTVVFNSGGQSTGYVPGDTLFITGTVAPGGISVYGNITGSGTTLTSQFNIEGGIATITSNGVYPFFMEKSDGYSSGSTLRIYYSTDFVNFSPITKL
jgi:hypothetical protein